MESYLELERIHKDQEIEQTDSKNACHALVILGGFSAAYKEKENLPPFSGRQIPLSVFRT